MFNELSVLKYQPVILAKMNEFVDQNLLKLTFSPCS